MTNAYYNGGSFPATGAAATSASMRAELALVSAGFDKLPTLAGNANKLALINSSGTALTVASTLTETAGGLVYTGTLTGGTGVVNLGSGQFYKDALGKIGIASTAPQVRFVVDRLGTGVNPPSYNSGTTAAFIGSSTSGSPSIVNIVSGNAATGAIFFGDTDADSRGRVQYDHSADSLAFWTQNSAKAIITNDGSVGIGTTDPTGGYGWSSAARILGIAGDASASTASYGAVALANNRATPTATDDFGVLAFTSPNSVAGQTLKAFIKGTADGAGGVTGGYGGQFQFYTKGDNTASTAGLRMQIDSAGDVQIGTSTAGLGKLRILDSGSQTIELTSSDTSATNKSAVISVSRYTSTDAPFTLIRGQSSVSTNSVYIGGGASASAPATDITFYTGALSAVGATGTEAMRIDSAGNVGIGTTNPGAPLEVSTTGVVAAQFISTSASTVGPRVYLYHDSASPAIDDAISEIRLNANNSLGAATIYGQIVAVAKNVTSGSHSTQLQFNTAIAGATQATMVLDAEGNVQTPMGALVVKAPAHGSFAAATTLVNADLKKYIINTTGTTYTLTMPTGATMETLVDWYTTNLGFDFYIVNTASGTITLGANSNTTLGSLTIATGTSAQFRIRRTGASAFTIYRLS